MSKISLKHSGGKVVSLNSPTTEPNANDVAFKLPNADGSDGQALVTDGSGNLSFGNVAGGSARNLIINGAMQVAQRGTSSTSSGYATVDRWTIQNANIGVTVTQSQQATSSSDEPYQNGFQNFARIALASAGTTNTNAYIDFQQRMEAQDIANSGWNFKSSSSNITVSFWFRCSTNQTFYAWVTSGDGTNKRFTFSFTASGDNAWTKVTKTIPGASDIQIDNNIFQGLSLMIAPFYGTDYTGSVSLDTWVTKNDATHSPDYASTWLTAGASTFDITGVQLEVGSVATDFEHRSFGQELALCQRYFYLHTDAQTNSGKEAIGTGTWYNGYNMYTSVHFPTTMRTVPSLYQVSGTDYFFYFAAGTGQGFDGFNEIWRSSKNMAYLGEYDESSTSNASSMIVTNNTNARLGFNAEL